ncbi:MAG: hypothetical protein E7264_11370 [Lachnospiraceae bacterium]|nr:hypothetical protein [Lachnospiraceae bacterium]
MNKQENKLALSVLTTLISGIALIYTLITYHHIIFAVMGMSLIFLICAYILTQNIIAFSLAKTKASNNQIKEYMQSIIEQIDAMNGTQSQLGKATYLYTKQAAQTVATLENNYLESQEALYKNLSSLSNAQNKATKLMIKYDQNNTTKLISTIKELRNQLSDTMIQGFDQIQPNNAEVITTLEDIVNYLKTQPSGSDQTLNIQLNNVAHELQNISNNMQHFQMTMPGTASVPQPSIPITETAPVTEPTPTMHADISSTPNDNSSESLTNDDIAALFAATEPAPMPENTMVQQEETFTPTFTVIGKSDTYENEIDPLANTGGNEDPNKQLSADEIAALFAAADPAPKKEAAPATPIEALAMSDDPNKQLSADEIAALFAAAEPAPTPEEPIAEPLAPTLSDDPNKQLSADEIAALFASLG